MAALQTNMTPLAIAALLAWIGLAFFRKGFWRVRFPSAAPSPAQWPQVVAVVPARDEAEVIAPALRTLLQQDYPGQFHVIVVDDHSTDGTATLAQATAGGLHKQGKLTLVQARELPPGWTGKVWAQSEGLRLQQQRFPDARYMWLTDADIAHDLRALRDLVAGSEHAQLVLNSQMVRLRCVALAEKALMPAFVFFFAMLYPFSLVNNPRSRVAAAAGGCMLARTDALAAIGGVASIRNALIDDCALAARMKRQGPIRLDLARSSRSLRAYGDWSLIFDMVARSAYTQLRHSPLLLLATVLGMLLLYVVPPLLAFRLEWPALAAWLLMVAIYAPMLRYYGRSPVWAPALPLIALFYLGATVASAWRYRQGKGGRWKGRAQAVN
jgi:hopene-associated glycosyltransferase HpnB